MKKNLLLMSAALIALAMTACSNVSFDASADANGDIIDQTYHDYIYEVSGTYEGFPIMTMNGDGKEAKNYVAITKNEHANYSTYIISGSFKLGGVEVLDLYGMSLEEYEEFTGLHLDPEGMGYYYDEGIEKYARIVCKETKSINFQIDVIAGKLYQNNIDVTSKFSTANLLSQEFTFDDSHTYINSDNGSDDTEEGSLITEVTLLNFVKQ